jgi:hypothetical protein
MGKLIGLFGAGASSIKHGEAAKQDTAQAFNQDEEETNESLDRMKKLEQMLRDVNK